MEKKQYFNLNNLRANDSRTIIDKQWYHSEEEDPEFNRCDSPEDKSRIRHEAKYIYKQLLSSPDNRCVRTIDSEIIRVNYYAVTFDSVKTTPDGRVFNETADAIDYDFAYNPYYYKKLSKELNKLARKDDLYLNVSLDENKMSESYVMTVSSLTREQFENIYGITLEQFYDAINEKVPSGNSRPRRETLFIKAIARLRKSYYEFMIADINRGFDTSDIEMDGYRSYLSIKYDFRDVPNQEEILKELGFVVDPENYSLRLVNARGHQPIYDK